MQRELITNSSFIPSSHYKYSEFNLVTWHSMSSSTLTSPYENVMRETNPPQENVTFR